MTMNKATNTEHHNIEPLFDKDSKTLILGSFPSVKSRESAFFYAHPQNRFWKVIAQIYEKPVPASVEEKKQLILENHLALFDVIKQCDISGSSDISVKSVVANDISPLIESSKITKIYVNGKTAEKYYIKYIEPTVKIKCICLPSTSPANAAFSLQKLVEYWKIITL